MEGALDVFHAGLLKLRGIFADDERQRMHTLFVVGDPLQMSRQQNAFVFRCKAFRTGGGASDDTERYLRVALQTAQFLTLRRAVK